MKRYDDFRRQIQEDLEDYKEKFPNIGHIDTPEWAFNFWVLDKLFSEDENLIEEKIVDYDDNGIDCYIWHEDSHDLYLIQNKYYGDESRLTLNYIMNDFLTRTIGALEKGSYTRCKTLQKIYDKYSAEDDFTIQFNLYVTNNTAVSAKITAEIASYNEKYPTRTVHLYLLKDIEELYYKEPTVNKKTMSYTITTINKGTILNINKEAYKMTVALDAKYVLTPVIDLFNMYKAAMQEKYPIFDANIREYLGSNGNVNKKIMQTLRDPEDRANFFYYNNGITIIVDNISVVTQKHGNAIFTIDNPQIVNGCQTVSTINETLSALPSEGLENEFKNTFVMLKILKIPSNEEKMVALYKNIVTYNNSQNAINQKTFVANSTEFQRIQIEFERRGLLICIKQSDKYTFSEKYKSASKLIDRNSELLELFGIQNMNKTKSFFINLDKFLQVILSFISTSQDAIQHKSKLLQVGTEQNKRVVEFIKNKRTTINSLIRLYLLYMRAEQDKQGSADGKTPIPLYLINCFAHYECQLKPERISEILDSKEAIDNIMRLYKATIKTYSRKWKDSKGTNDYNSMIKSMLDFNQMDDARQTTLDTLDSLL